MKEVGSDSGEVKDQWGQTPLIMTSYTWTNARLTGMTTPSGQAIGYGYTNGRISSVTEM